MAGQVWKTSKNHLRLFKHFVKKHLGDFRLNDWIVKVTHEAEEDVDAYSSVRPGVQNKVAEINLATEWISDPTLRNVEEIAYHEVVHILLAPLVELAKDRYATEKAIDDAEHQVIRNMLIARFGVGYEKTE